MFGDKIAREVSLVAPVFLNTNQERSSAQSEMFYNAERVESCLGEQDTKYTKVEAKLEEI